jgi:hypothetical protein
MGHLSKVLCRVQCALNCGAEGLIILRTVCILIAGI